MKKRIISIALCVFMVLSLLPTTVFAADVVASGGFGSYGSGAWSLDSDGLLSISGEVGMSGCDAGVPWYNYRASVKSVAIAPNSYAKEGAVLGFMFKDCSELTSLDMTNLDTSNVTSMLAMFEGCSKLSTINLSGFDTSNVTETLRMFEGCSSLTSINLSSFNTSKVTNARRMFLGCSSLASLDLTSFDTTNFTNMSFMLSDCSALTSISFPSVVGTSALTDISNFFYGCYSLTSLDLSSFNTSSVTTMRDMFAGCTGLVSINLSSFDTSKVTTMLEMFFGCSSLTSLDLSGFDTSAVTTMESMFRGCSALTSINMSSLFNTANVTKMNQMFSGCEALASLDLSSFDTSKVEKMGYMFLDCSSLTFLDLSSFNNLVVTDMFGMLCNCSSLISLNLTNFGTAKVTNMSLMFDGCSSLTSLDLSSFDTSSAPSMGSMFRNCGKPVDGVPAQGLVCNAAEAEKFNNPSKTGIDRSKLNFTVKCNVTLHANDGSDETETITTIAGSYNLPENSFTAPTGMQFMGWAYTSDGEVIYDTAIELTGSIDFYAVWDEVHEFVHHDAKPATCTENGWYAYDTCKLCDYTSYREIPATGHSFVFDRFEWDGFTAKAIYVCEHDATHTQEFTATITSAVITEQDCETNGETVYTATYIGEDGTHTDTKTEVIAAAGHSCNAEWESDGANHWHVCSVCGAKVDETAHSGGEATCTEKAVCEICEAEYGECDPHSYTVSQHDETQHWHKCENCDAITEKVNHFGGEATCIAKAVCEGCGGEYGEMEEHDYVWMYYIDDNHHQRVCTFCKNQIDIGEHYGGNATCTSFAKCEACGLEYGDFADHIADESEWLSNEYAHWHKCSNPDCTKKVDLAEHTPDYNKATEEHGRTCTVCGYDIEEALVPISIEIACVPAKIKYMVGDAVSTAGLKVTVSYSNGCKADVTASVSVTDFNTTAVGDKIATVSYKGITATFDYSVALIPTIKIQNNPGSKTINYGEGIEFTAVVTDMPEDARIVWYVNDKKAGEGESFTFSDAKADATITVKIVDKDGNVIKDATGGEISESEKVTVKAGFFQKLISFFKNLFKINRIVAQAFIKEN